MWSLLIAVCFLGKCELFEETYPFRNESACIIAGAYNKQIYKRWSLELIVDLAKKNKWDRLQHKLVVSGLRINYKCSKK